MMLHTDEYDYFLQYNHNNFSNVLHSAFFFLRKYLDYALKVATWKFIQGEVRTAVAIGGNQVKSLVFHFLYVMSSEKEVIH